MQDIDHRIRVPASTWCHHGECRSELSTQDPGCEIELMSLDWI